MWIRFRNMFIAGLAVIFPIAITLFIVRLVVVFVNNWILNPLMKFLSPYLNTPYHIYAAKIGVFICVMFFVYLIGLAANIIVIRKFFGLGEKIFLKIPMFGRIYQAIKQISSAFIGEGKTIFKKVVLIEYPRKGVYSIGFLTGETKGETQFMTKEVVYNIFLPTTPNPTSGLFLLVPRNEVKFLDMTVEEGMKMIVSGGAVMPPFKAAKSNGNN